MKQMCADGKRPRESRSLHWGRGLKLKDFVTTAEAAESLPSLGAWIETFKNRTERGCAWRRSLHWGRGLKQARLRCA